MASRLLSALDARIAKCRDPVENACLRAEKAALLARQGYLDAARAELAIVHARYDGRPNAVVSAWVNLAEGLIAFYGSLSLKAKDKLIRAIALSSAVGNRDVWALGAAWLANMNYLEQDFGAMVRNLSLALMQAAAQAESALARACLVVAQGYHWANRYDLAHPWYNKAHRHATNEGDTAMLSTLMHNMAWLKAAQARRLSVSGVEDREQVRQILLGAESTGHFDKGIGTASLQSLIPMLRAHILAMLGLHSDALRLFDKHLQASLSQGLDRMHSGMLAEMAWCRVNVGDVDGANRDAREADDRVKECDQPDERAAAHGRLAQVCDALGDQGAAVQHRAQADILWQLHTARQEQLIELLSDTVGSAI